MNVFGKKGKICEQDNKTNIAFRFTVSKNAKRLVVKFSYFPKTVENKEKALSLVEKGFEKYGIEGENKSDYLPLNNLITLSFDENGKYRGACHRHPNEQTIIISDKSSTPGIINMPLECGEWQAVLNVHFAGCEIEYSLDIEEETI